MEEDLFRCGEQLSCDSVGPSNRISEPAAAVSSTFKDVADSHTDRNAQLNSSHDPKSLVRCTDNADASSCKNDIYNSPDSQICVNSGRVLVVETLCSGNVEERTLFTRDLTKAASENLTGSDHICFIKQQHRNSDLHNVSAVSDTQTSTDNNVSEISATSRHKNCTVQVPVKHMTLQAPTAINHITSQVYTAVEQVHSQTKKSIHCKDSAFDTGEHKVFINIQPSSQDIPPATQTVSHLSSSVSQTQKRTASEAHHLQQEAEFSIDTPAHSNNPACPTTQESNGSVYPGTVQFSSSGFQHRRSEAQSDDQRTIIVAQNNDSVPGTISYKEKLQFENALQDHNLDLNRTVHFRGYDMQASKKSCGSKIACGSEKSNLLTQTVSQNLQNEDEALVGDLAIQKELHVNSGIPTALKSFDSVHHAPVEDCCKDEIFQTTSNIEQHITRDSRSEGHINTSDSRTEGCIDTSDSRTEDRIDTSEHNACLLPAADAFSATQAHDSDAESMILIMTRSSSLESSSTLAQESSLCTAPCVDTRTATAQAPHCNSFGSLEATDVYSRAVEAVASTSHGQAQLECTDTENKTVVDHSFDIQTTVEGTKIANAIVTQMNDQRIEIALNSNESLAEMKLGIQHTSVSGQSVVEGASLVRSSDLQDGSTESQTAPRHTNLALETALVGGCCEAQTAVIHTDVGAQTFRQQSDLALTDSGIINSVTEINNSGLESSSAVHCRSQEMKSNLQEDTHEIQTNKQTISRTRELMKEVESTMAICGVKTVISVDSYVVEQDQEPKAYLFTNDNSFHNTDALGDYMDIAEPNIISEDQSSLHVMNTEALKPVENGNSGIQSVLPQSQDVNFDTDVNVRTSENCITCKDNMLPEKYDAGPVAKMSKTFDVLAHSEDAAPPCTEHSKSIPQDLKHQPCVHVEKSHMSTTQGKCSDYRGVVKLDTKLSSFGGDEKYSSSTENIGSSLGTCVGENIDKKGEKNASISGGKIDMSLGKSVNDDKVDMSLGKSVGHNKTQLSLGKSIDADKTVMNLRKSVDGVKPDMNLGKPLSDEKINAILEQTHSFYKINTKVDTCVNYKKTNTKVDTCVNYKKTNTQDVSAESGKIDGKSNFVGDKKFDTNLTACMDVKMGRNVGATIREKCETHSGTPVHDEKVDIDLRASVLNEKGDTNLSASVGNEKGDTNLGVSVSNEKGDTNLGVSVSNEKGDTNLGVSVSNEKGDTNLGASVSNEKGDTNLGVSVSNEKGDTNLSASVGNEKGDTNLGVSVSNEKDDTNLGAVSNEKGDTNLGASVGNEKRDTNLGVSVSNEKGDTNLSVSVGNEKSDTNLGVSLSNEKRDTNLSVSVGNEKSDTNLGVSLSKGKGDTNLGVSVGNEKSDTNLGVSVGNEKSDTNLEKSANNEKIDTNASIYVSDGDDTNFSIYVSDADDTHASIYVSDGDESASVDVVSVSDADEDKRDTPEEAARKLPKLKVVLKRCDTSQTSLYNHRSETPDSQSSESHTSEIPKRGRKRKRSSDGSLIANSNKTKSYKQKLEESKLSQRGNKQKLDEGKLSQKGTKKIMHTLSDTSHSSRYNHRRDASDSQSSESHTSEIPKRGRKKKRSDESSIANSSKTRSYKQKLKESKLTQRGNKRAKSSSSDSSQTSRYETSDWESSQSYTTEKPKKRKKWKRSSVRSLIANKSKTKSYKQKHEQSKLSHQSVKRAKYTMRKFNNYKSTRGGKSQTGSNTAKKSTTGYSKEFKPLRTCVYSNQNNRTRPSRYFNLRSLDVMRSLRSKAEISSKNDKRSASCGNTLAQKKKNYTTKAKHKPPPESPPLDPTLPFVEVDLDIVVDESQYFEPIEPALEDAQPQPQPEQTKKKRGKPKAHKVSTGSNSTVSSGSQFVDAAACDLRHKCCQKAAITTSEVSTQWEDPSRWYAALETLTSKAKRSNVKTELTDDSTHVDAFIRDMTIVQGNQNLQRDQDLNLHGDQSYNLHGGQNYNQQDQNYNLQGGQNYNQQDQNYNLQGGQNYNQQDQSYNLQGGQNYNLQDQNYNQQDQNYNLQGDQSYNLQGGQSYNLQGGHNYNLQGGQNYNQDQSYNLQGDQNYNQQDQNYNVQGDQNYNQQDQNYNLQAAHNYNLQDQNYNLQGAQNYNLHGGHNYEQLNQQYLPTYSNQNTAEDIKMAACEPLLSAFSRPATVSSMPGNQLPAAAEDILVGWQRPQSSHLFGTASSSVVPVSVTSVHQTSQDLGNRLNFQYDLQSDVHSDTDTTHSNNNCLKFQRKKSRDVSKDSSCTKDSHSPAPPHNLDLTSCRKKNSRDIPIDSASSTEDLHTAASQRNLDLNSQKKKSREISIDSASSTEDSHTAAAPRNLDLKSQKKKKSREISRDSASSTEDLHTAAPRRNLDLKSQKKKKNSREIVIDSASSTEDSHTAAAQHNLDLKSKKKKKSRDISIDSASSTEDLQTAAPQRNFDLKSQKKNKSRDISKDSANSTKDSNKAAPPKNSDIKRKKLKRNKKTAGGPKKRRKDGDDSVMIVIDDSNGDSDVNIVCIEGHIPSS